jgi:hypothetical protein
VEHPGGEDPIILPKRLVEGASLETCIQYALRLARTAEQIHGRYCKSDFPRDSMCALHNVQKSFPDLVRGPIPFKISIDIALSMALINGYRPAYERNCGTILLRDGVEPDWANYLVIREMFQILLDAPDLRTGENLAATLIKMRQEWHAEKPETSARPTFAELLAEIAAVEFLYPSSVRSGNPSKINVKELASKYLLPEKIIDYYQSKKMSSWLADVDQPSSSVEV